MQGKGLVGFVGAGEMREQTLGIQIGEGANAGDFLYFCCFSIIIS